MHEIEKVSGSGSRACMKVRKFQALSIFFGGGREVVKEHSKVASRMFQKWLHELQNQ
jgi:hypothetical protein